MSRDLWVAYTPDGFEFFSTEKEAQIYLKDVLISDDMWNEVR
jgi:hypothetical protein